MEEVKNPFVVIMGAIILILVGMAFITTVADTKSTQTSLLTTSDEQSNLQTLSCYTSEGQVNESNSACNITVDNWYTSGDWRESEGQCYLSSVTLANDTGTELTLDTDYRLFDSSGIIQLLNTTTTENSSDTMSNNLVEVDYSYCGEGYLTSSGDRGLANLFPTLMIIVLIIALGGAAMKMYNEN